MAKVWDRCIDCYKDIPESSTEKWRKCSGCSWTHGAVAALLFLALVGLWAACWKLGLTTHNLLVGVGYSADILGAWTLINGYTELFTLASTGFGGPGSTFKQFGLKGANKRRLGVVLLVVGFLFQGIASLS